MSQNHPSAAVPVETELVKRNALDGLLRLALLLIDIGTNRSLALSLDLLDEINVKIVLVSDNLNRVLA